MKEYLYPYEYVLIFDRIIIFGEKPQWFSLVASFA